jgi:hypothetical protein
MSNNLNTVINLDGVDIDSLTPDNFLTLTKAAGKNPGPDGNPRGYRLRIPKNIAARTVGSVTRNKMEEDGTLDHTEPTFTAEQARQYRLDEIVATYRVSVGATEEND